MENKKYINGKDQKEYYQFLDNNKKVSAKMYGDILDLLNDLQEDYPLFKILLHESDEEEPLGIIIDVYDDEENVATETIWYDDYTE